MQTLDEMRDRCLLTPQQHAEIGAWVSQARTPEGSSRIEPRWDICPKRKPPLP